MYGRIHGMRPSRDWKPMDHRPSSSPADAASALEAAVREALQKLG